ncbi:hypothetical protein RHMOL_Rhmol06G0037200 [Rhododendron molle]|uniref:Uncharacterized protein n=1 Tax=Rhododendron molle TaxID=49168 RepID=A0ACC0N9W4_RHOML|nr:hypothetical protein RHMOL_Rhmol06G0037200 [Rhododendron molle]
MGILQMSTVWIPLCNQKVLDYFLNPRYDNNLHQILLDVSRAKDLCLHEVMIEASGFDARYWEAKKLRFICHVEVVEIECVRARLFLLNLPNKYDCLDFICIIIVRMKWTSFLKVSVAENYSQRRILLLVPAVRILLQTRREELS